MGWLQQKIVVATYLALRLNVEAADAEFNIRTFYRVTTLDIVIEKWKIPTYKVRQAAR